MRPQDSSTNAVSELSTIGCRPPVTRHLDIFPNGPQPPLSLDRGQALTPSLPNDFLVLPRWRWVQPVPETLARQGRKPHNHVEQITKQDENECFTHNQLSLVVAF